MTLTDQTNILYASAVLGVFVVPPIWFIFRKRRSEDSQPSIWQSMKVVGGLPFRYILAPAAGLVAGIVWLPCRMFNRNYPAAEERWAYFTEPFSASYAWLTQWLP